MGMRTTPSFPPFGPAKPGPTGTTLSSAPEPRASASASAAPMAAPRRKALAVQQIHAQLDRLLRGTRAPYPRHLRARPPTLCYASSRWCIVTMQTRSRLRTYRLNCYHESPRSLISTNPMRTLILSDTHVSAGPLDDCDTELDGHIAAFLRTHATLSPPVELILNGDFLDFVQAPPYEDSALRAPSSSSDALLCFTQSQSREKLQNIAHRHPAIFCALGAFLRSHPRNSLVILPGNHDPDFFWPRVRTDFCKLLSLPSATQMGAALLRRVLFAHFTGVFDHGCALSGAFSGGRLQAGGPPDGPPAFFGCPTPPGHRPPGA